MKIMEGQEFYAVVYRNLPDYKGCDEYLAGERYLTDGGPKVSIDLRVADRFKTREDAENKLERCSPRLDDLDDAHSPAEIVKIRETVKFTEIYQPAVKDTTTPEFKEKLKKALLQAKGEK